MLKACAKLRFDLDNPLADRERLGEPALRPQAAEHDEMRVDVRPSIETARVAA